MKALGCALLLACAPGCATLVQHPAPTIGAVAGVIGFGTCEMDGVHVGTCGIVGGSAAVFLGGVAALVYLLTDQPTPQMEGEEVEPGERVGRRHHVIVLPPPPDEPDAGSGSDQGSGSGSGTGTGTGTGSGS